MANFGNVSILSVVQHNRVSRYRDRDSSCSEQEWEDYLVSLLVDKHPIGDLDAVAENKEEGYLTIDVRKKSSGRAVCRRLDPLPSSQHSQLRNRPCARLELRVYVVSCHRFMKPSQLPPMLTTHHRPSLVKMNKDKQNANAHAPIL